jgi:perosamine synthetase
MENNFIPVNTPLLNGNELKYVSQCIETGWISSEGPYVKEFEQEFSTKIGRKYGIAVANGSVALDAAIVALGIEKGDEVILPAFTIISCAAAIVRAGAIPVLIDADPVNWNMDVAKIEEKITSKTKAIMVVHIYGLPVDMDPILELCKKYKLLLIEDAAEMHGQTYNGKPCGSFGDISIFSFYPNKHITTGEGGMIVTDSFELSEKSKSLRNLCFMSHKRFFHEELGWNFRMTNIQAALGVAQLERLDEFIIKKRQIGALYSKYLKDCPFIQIPKKSEEYAENIYWVFGVVLDASFPENAQWIMNELSKVGIGTRPFFYPMHLQPVFNKMGLFQNESYPVAENLAERGFYLPSGLGILDSEIERSADALLKILNTNA